MVSKRARSIHKQSVCGVRDTQSVCVKSVKVRKCEKKKKSAHEAKPPHTPFAPLRAASQTHLTSASCLDPSSRSIPIRRLLRQEAPIHCVSPDPSCDCDGPLDPSTRPDLPALHISSYFVHSADCFPIFFREPRHPSAYLLFFHFSYSYIPSTLLIFLFPTVPIHPQSGTRVLRSTACSQQEHKRALPGIPWTRLDHEPASFSSHTGPALSRIIWTSSAWTRRSPRLQSDPTPHFCPFAFYGLFCLSSTAPV